MGETDSEKLDKLYKEFAARSMEGGPEAKKRRPEVTDDSMDTGEASSSTSRAKRATVALVMDASVVMAGA